ncbi:MAG TPA: phosphoglucosamine mutase [Solirubrobacterales bacterium]|nr:phosphoglucosamine mutase [Solirubrobacterales bacterium]
MAAKLFGTDGVRGVAGTELTAEIALALGRAGAMESGAERPQVLIVRDTRESGPMLEAALAAGVAEAGGDAWLGGVLPTPAASILVRRHGLDLAAVVSASHNPWRHNGVKFFGADGRKLEDDAEAAIEARVAEGAGEAGAPLGRVRNLDGALDDYRRALLSAFQLDLSGRRLLLDCANGATYRAAPSVFERLGAAVETMAADPDGRNINEGCGSTHPELLAEAVGQSGAEIGFAFDGDGDRVVAVDATGVVRDGDELLALCARHLADAGALQGGVAVTVMSNYGFHRAMAEAEIEVSTTPVGDRNVIAELEGRGWALGGEQSGHIIWSEYGPTGDGIAAALLVMRALGDAELAGAIPMRKLPQVLENVEISNRDALEQASAVWQAVERESDAVEGRGRVLVRASGTEPLIRVMVEAPTEEECTEVCARLATIIRRELS